MLDLFEVRSNLCRAAARTHVMLPSVYSSPLGHHPTIHAPSPRSPKPYGMIPPGLLEHEVAPSVGQDADNSPSPERRCQSESMKWGRQIDHDGWTQLPPPTQEPGHRRTRCPTRPVSSTIWTPEGHGR